MRALFRTSSRSCSSSVRARLDDLVEVFGGGRVVLDADEGVGLLDRGDLDLFDVRLRDLGDLGDDRPIPQSSLLGNRTFIGLSLTLSRNDR